MKARDLTPEERWLFMPKWKKCLLGIFIVLLPFIGSIDGIMF